MNPITIIEKVIEGMVLLYVICSVWELCNAALQFFVAGTAWFKRNMP